MARGVHAFVAFLFAGVVLATVAGASGDSALVKAVKAGDLQVVRSLVKSGTDVNAASGDGSTP